MTFALSFVSIGVHTTQEAQGINILLISGYSFLLLVEGSLDIRLHFFIARPMSGIWGTRAEKLALLREVTLEAYEFMERAEL